MNNIPEDCVEYLLQYYGAGPSHEEGWFTSQHSQDMAEMLQRFQAMTERFPDLKYRLVRRVTLHEILLPR